ncbi:MAG TPA: leucine-rich repeat protein [Verrucomicrobiae bacterium]|jgi:hypothetical protein
MKRTWNVLVALLLLAAPSVLQAQFTYTTNADNTLTLSGYSGAGGEVDIPSSFDGLTVADIGTNVFAGLLDLSNVVMPDTIVSVGSLAFSECFNLTNVVMSDSLAVIGSGAFGFCSSLTNVAIPGTVTNIQDFGFIFCTNLLSVSIPPSVGLLGQAVFQDCISLTNLVISPGVPMLGDEEFVSCTKLRSVTIPGSVTSFGANDFQNCTSLSRVTLNAGVPYVGASMFEADPALSVVILPSTITNIEEYAFSGSGLVNLTFPSSLRSINQYAFAGSFLTNVTLPSSLQSIGDGAFSGTMATSASIPASVTNIGIEVWIFCANLTNISVAPANTAYSSLNKVLFDAAQDTLIEFPDGLRGAYSIPGTVDNIAEGAFAACTLSNVTVDAGDTNISVSAFYDCLNLVSLFFDGNAPVTDPSAFKLDTHATIYYLPGTTGWSSPFAGLPAVLAESIVWPAPAGFNYGTPLTTNQLNATANVPGTFVYNPPLGSVPNAGSDVLTLVFTPSNTTFLIVVTNTVNLAVAPVPLTITADGATKNYGNTLVIAEAEFTSTGLVNGDAITNLTLSSPGAAAGATAAGSPYPIVPSAAMPASLANNYNITYQNGQLTVLPAPLSITANNTNKPYGATVNFTGNEFVASGLVNGDSVSSVSLASAGAPATATVSGSPYPIVPSAAQPASLNNNYVITYNNGQLAVSLASLVITANSTNKNYGTAINFAGTEFAVHGLANGDTVSSVTLASAGAAANAPVSGSPYFIFPSAAQPSSLSGNYSISYATGQLTVGAVPLTITANNTNKNYGNKLNFAGTEFASSGLVAGDTISSVTLTSAGTPSLASVSGSPYPIVPGAPVISSAAGNYVITYNNGALTINPVNVAVAAGLSANDKYYDGTTLATLSSNSVSLTGIIGNDSANVSLNTNGYTANFASAGAGAHIPVAVSGLTLSGTAAVNYNLVQPAGLAASITVPGLQIAYGNPNVIVSWPASAAAFVLNAAASLSAPGPWSAITTGITVNGTSNTVTLSASGAAQFFELIAPPAH